MTSVLPGELRRRLLDRWNEPHRHYHTAEHLTAMLAVIDKHADLAARPDAVRLAAWFHDAVYDPRSTGNEAASAALAEAELTALHAHPELIAEVVRLVHLTTGHDPAPTDANGRLLCDADLAILAAEPAAYDRYAAAVRREYAHVPEPAYRAGRAAVLTSLHDRPTLYHVVPQRAAWTDRARANLVRELATL